MPPERAKRPPAAGSKTDPTGIDLVVEIGEQIDKGLEGAHHFFQHANGALKYLTGSQAFRKYSWIRNKPIKNAMGHFRGMIVSKEWKAAYDVTLENAEKLEKYDKYFILAGILLDLLKKHDKIIEISKSNQPVAMKAQRYMAMGSMAIFNTIGAPIVPITHGLAQAFAGACNLSEDPSICAMTVRNLEMSVTTSYEELMDSDKVVDYINLHPDMGVNYIKNYINLHLVYRGY